MGELFENIGNNIIQLLLSIPGIVLAFTFKGFSQSFVSKKLGDPTPEAQGRLTLNPLKHIDIFGFICMLLFRIGWGKPIPTNSRFYKNPKRDRAIYCISGAAGLIILSFFMAMTANLLTAVFYAFGGFLPDILQKSLGILVSIFYIATQYPLFLANFYMLPLPGLDGYNLITNFVPYRYNETLFKIEKFSFIIFIVFILLMDYTILGEIIFFPATGLTNLFNSIWGFIWGLIF